MGLWQRLKFKFRVSILDENTFAEVFHLRLSLLTIFTSLFIMLVVVIGLLSLLVIYTPISYYLPGHIDDSMREEIVASTMRIDSLTNEVELQARYADMIREILSGEVSSDSVVQLDSMTLNEKRELLTEKSRLLEEFNAEYEAKEKYELSLFVGQPDVRKYVFFKPAQGVISQPYNPADGRYGISLATTKNSNVASVLPGAVIYTDFTLENAWSVMVQHDNDYISVYKNNVRLLKRVGESVKAGEVVAVAGTDVGDDMVFELWQKGSPIDPTTVIAF